MANKTNGQFYKTVPALAAYIDRIGAEELNFRRYMVKEYRGHYYHERALIRIDKDGSIKCSNKDYAPTEEEAAAIKAAMVTEKFPHSILARDTLDLLKLIPGTSTFFEFYSRKESGIIMVQERRIFDDGHKQYFPWTMFSDGKWRMMEPDGPLPFWKPYPADKFKKPRIMVHEGAKPAAFVTEKLKDAEWKHPWREELEKYEHWGIIGGALAPHRSDYDELRREKPLEVVYCCDNDELGKAALKEVSKMYGQTLKGALFDKDFPESWDLADPMPEKLFKEFGIYKGPSLRSLMIPATRATEKAPNPDGRGAPISILRRPFKEEWLHCITPEVFIHKDFPDDILMPSEFNSKVAPYSDVEDTARLLKKEITGKSSILKYSPALQSGIYGGEGGRFINTHVGSGIKPIEGDPKPFLDFMEHLIVDDKDRLELMRWCATLLACPDIKMLYGVLLISETQGVGKSCLGEYILQPILGKNNVSQPSENDIVEASFNYWCAHKRLVVVHEIYAGHSAKAYNKLKSIITDRLILINKKFQAAYDIDNWVHVFACSNSLRALQLSGDDRRWFVPKVTEEKKPYEWWKAFHSWLNDGIGHSIILWWAHEFLKENKPVMRGDDAPWSAVKKQVIEEGYSPGMTLVSNFLGRVKEEMKDPKWLETYTKPSWINGEWKPSGVLVIDTDLVQLIKSVIYEGRQSDRLEKPATVRKVAKLQGWHISEHKVSTLKWGTYGTSTKLVCSSKTLAGSPISNLVECVRPLDVEKLAQDWKM
jgi:Family of unknown function (DUF5906)